LWYKSIFFILEFDKSIFFRHTVLLPDMEAVDNSRHDQDHHAAAAFSVELEVELVGEGNNGAATTRTVPEQEDPEPRTEGRRRPAGRARRLARRLHPATVARACWRWLKHPAHLALVAWALCVAASGTMLVLLLLGSLNSAIPRRSIRNRWIEINNQVLNALFTLMSIYQHPALFHHAAHLLRWRPADAKELREAYCRKSAGAGARRGDRVHMSVVVALLHAACFSQYAMCGLYWGYSRRARPDDALTSLTVVGTVTPVVAGLYMYFSPLGRKRGGRSVRQDPDERSAASSDVEVALGAEWAGGLLDVGDDPTVCWFSCLCTFCVFGWNMERLGFGNAHVHTAMFALLCFAPLWVLSAAALNIRDDDVGFAVGVTGVVLCALGLLYGGFWRARMRRKYGLPSTNACCAASPSLADYGQWMFCWSCALAQEVRTADILLDVEAGSVNRPDSDGRRVDAADAQALQPLPRESGVKSFHQGGSSNLAEPATIDTHSVQLSSYRTSRGDESPLLLHDQGSRASSGEMTPPVPPSIPEGERR
jgi:Cys-rich protein (TIGR01571 family)